MVLGHFGPFASQVGAMNYAESERRADPRFTGRGIRWFVDPLTAPERVTQGLGELRLRLLGWHGSALNFQPMNSTKSREVIWGGRIMAAKVSAEQAPQTGYGGRP